MRSRLGLVALWATAVVLAEGEARAGELYCYVGKNGVFNVVDSPKKARGPRCPLYEAPSGDGFGGEGPVVIASRPRPARTSLAPMKVSRFDEIFRAAAQSYGLPFALLKAVAHVESNFDPLAVSPADAKGLMQLMDGTARQMDVSDPFDPGQAIFGAARYLGLLFETFEGDLVKAAAAYNAGPERVLRAGGVPAIAETRQYVRRVLELYRHYRLQEPSAW